MTWRRIGLAALLTSVLPWPAVGGQHEVDVSKLPVNVQRIQRQLRQAAVREERDGLNLQYFVDVYGQAPRIELFPKQENVLTGPTPYGAPTHRDMIDAMTPQEFRTPGADFSGLFRWLASKGDRSRK